MLLLDLFLVGLAAVAGGWVCRRIGVPEVLGYLAAGILLGPHTLGASFVRDVDAVRGIASFAVVFRMFSLGLDFDARRLAGRWRPALLAGGFEMGACTLAGLALAAVLGWPLLEGAILGAALGTTSTNILTKALADRNMTNRDDARAAGAATLAEDVIAMSLVALLAVFHGASGPAEVLENAMWLLVFAGLALTAGAILAPVALDRVARSRADELLMLAVVGLLFGFAALSESLGAGRHVGAFLAGIAVGAARQAPGVTARILPMRDVLAAMFYVSAGLLLDPAMVLAVAPAAALVAVVFVPLKVVVTTLGMRLGGVEAVTAARGGAILGQAGTLGIVAASQPFLSVDAFARLFAFAFVAWAITVALTPVRLRYLPDITERIARALGARGVPTRSPRLPTAPDPNLRSDLTVALLATGCAIAVAAVAAILAHGGDLFLPPPARVPTAVAAGLLAGALLVPFSLVVGDASRRAMRHGVHRVALAPHHLARGHGDPSRTLSVAGSVGGLAVVLAASLALAGALAPGATRIALLAGAGAMCAFLLARHKLLVRIAEECERLARERVVAATTASDPLRVARGAGFEVEAILVQDGMNAAWKTLRDLDVRHATGASVVAVLRGPARSPAPLSPDLALHPGDQLVLGGTPSQLVAARRHATEAAPDAPLVRA